MVKIVGLLTVAGFAASCFGNTLACGTYTLSQLAGNNVACNILGVSATVTFSNFNIEGGFISGTGLGVASAIEDLRLQVFAADALIPPQTYLNGFGILVTGGPNTNGIVVQANNTQRYVLTVQYDVSIIGNVVYSLNGGLNCSPCDGYISAGLLSVDINAPSGSFTGPGNAAAIVRDVRTPVLLETPFNTPQAELAVRATLDVLGPSIPNDANGNVMDIRSFGEVFQTPEQFGAISRLPEPSPSYLISAGLAALLVLKGALRRMSAWRISPTPIRSHHVSDANGTRS